MPTAVVCEDDDDIRGLVVAALRAHGYDVREAGTVADGLDEVAAGRVDGVVTDVALPDGSGVTVCHAAHAAGAHVVVMTAAADAALLDEVASCCSATVLAKPFTLAQLLAAVGPA